jgi:hypothetical protein
MLRRHHSFSAVEHYVLGRMANRQAELAIIEAQCKQCLEEDRNILLEILLKPNIITTAHSLKSLADVIIKIHSRVSDIQDNFERSVLDPGTIDPLITSFNTELIQPYNLAITNVDRQLSAYINQKSQETNFPQLVSTETYEEQVARYIISESHTTDPSDHLDHIHVVKLLEMPMCSAACQQAATKQMQVSASGGGLAASGWFGHASVEAPRVGHHYNRAAARAIFTHR